MLPFGAGHRADAWIPPDQLTEAAWQSLKSHLSRPLVVKPSPTGCSTSRRLQRANILADPSGLPVRSGVRQLSGLWSQWWADAHDDAKG
jgi:hypothetical protein